MNVAICLFYIIYHIFSEEDIAILKTSLYFFEEVSLKFPKNKPCENLIKPVIRLVLVSTSRIFSNKRILKNELREIKETVTNCLKYTMTKVTLAKTNLSVFNVQYKSHAQFEMQVRDALFCSLPLLMSCLIL